MRIEQPHTLGRQEAVQRIDKFLDGLVQEPPGGVTITNPTKDWNDGRMAFSFTAAMGGFGASVSGVMEVSDDLVAMQFELPLLVKSLLGEDRIARVVGMHLTDVLAPAPAA